MTSPGILCQFVDINCHFMTKSWQERIMVTALIMFMLGGQWGVIHSKWWWFYTVGWFDWLWIFIMGHIFISIQEFSEDMCVGLLLHFLWMRKGWYISFTHSRRGERPDREAPYLKRVFQILLSLLPPTDLPCPFWCRHRCLSGGSTLPVLQED